MSRPDRFLFGSLFPPHRGVGHEPMDGRHPVVGALRMAIDARRPDEPLIHHSDRGAQYTSEDFREVLARHGIECSMSGAANCYDNAVVESFFGGCCQTNANQSPQGQ